MGDKLFVKIERLRRLYQCTALSVRVQRSEAGGLGLGLSDENEIVEFLNPTNSTSLQIGDQVISVNSVSLVRERLGALLSRRFSHEPALVLLVSRPHQPRKPYSGDVFASLSAQRLDGSNIIEWHSDLWKARPDAVWGAFWTVTLPAATGRVSLALHRSLLLTDPLHGQTVLELDDLKGEDLNTRWHLLRAKGAISSSEIVGEVLLSVRRFASFASVSPRAHLRALENSDEEEELVVTPAQHKTEPLLPVVDLPDPAGD
uniref:PDZ domain-containing protein n=1 Tax=Coccolithus braarudii TaxID=221442 RepID=A0A7S0Q331_9EUKA|mmetsp:Transcript_42365/g.90478  ORF Transcript_42365/g.90478 Transcript_42365/m.90478 type:complete len:259 (+) Transcript_42365:20-796(+)